MQREEFLFSAGDRPENMGVVLAGSVRVVQEDYWGNRAILAVVEAGGLFGEAFVCARAETLPVSVVGHKEGSVLLSRPRPDSAGRARRLRLPRRADRQPDEILAEKKYRPDPQDEAYHQKDDEGKGAVLFVRVRRVVGWRDV